MQIGGVKNPMEAARWGNTPIIQKKAVEASKNAMTDDFAEKLQELARKDAQKGVYMSQEAINLRHAQMNKYVSPDRSAKGGEGAQRRRPHFGISRQDVSAAQRQRKTRAYCEIFQRAGWWLFW